MKRKRIAMTISLPPETAQAYERLARQTAKNRSQLFRDMFQLYQEQALEEDFSKLQRYGSKIAKKKGVITEKDVERLVFEGR